MTTSGIRISAFSPGFAVGAATPASAIRSAWTLLETTLSLSFGFTPAKDDDAVVPEPEPEAESERISVCAVIFSSTV